MSMILSHYIENMSSNSVLVLLLLISSQVLEGKLVVEEELLYDNFPENFIWGVASSSYQVEGGWNEGKIKEIIVFEK